MMIQDWFATPIYYNDMESDKIVAEKKEIIVESMVICIEVKDHDSRFIKFEGDSVYVNYKVTLK